MRGKNYIGGKWVDAQGGRQYESRNPANTGEVLGTVPLSHREEALQAVASAKETFPAWRALSHIKRGECIERFVHVVKGETEEIARLIARAGTNCLGSVGGNAGAIPGSCQDGSLRPGWLAQGYHHAGI